MLEQIKNTLISVKMEKDVLLKKLMSGGILRGSLQEISKYERILLQIDLLTNIINECS